MKNLKYLLICFVFTYCQEAKQAENDATEDPYLWLEEVEGDASVDWIKSQNEMAAGKIKEYPGYEDIRSKMLEAFNDEEKLISPQIVGDYAYHLWQDATNKRGVWRRMPLADFIANANDWEVVLDLDELSQADGKKWVFGGAVWLAPDNERCLISLSDGGTDESEYREFDPATKEFIKDGFFIPAAKSSVAWLNEDELLVGSDFGAGTLTSSGYARIAKRLKRGAAMEDAVQVFEADSTDVAVFVTSFTSDGTAYQGVRRLVTFYSSETYLFNDQDELVKVNYPEDARFSGVFQKQLMLHLQSEWVVNDVTYPIGTLVSMDLDKAMVGEVQVSSVYQPDSRSSFVSMSSTKDFMVVNSLENVQNKLTQYTWSEGEWQSAPIDVPEYSSIYLGSSSSQNNAFFYTYSNLITPSTLVYGNGDELKEVFKLKPQFDAANMTMNQYTVTSKDGTEIPYFIVHQKELNLNGKNPTLVYAYGGFKISSQPNYSYTRGIGWIERGGVYVLANIRGGGEFGPEWHKAALREKRQNAYDDFFAVTEDLIAKNITSPDYLGAFGWSNGGLMAGVVLTQRPEMYNAVVVGAPLLDMKRFNKMLAGASWMGEYGNPDVPEDWEFIQKYSPYHNISEDKEYPEALFITSMKDDRVHPGHARKMAAKMKDMGHDLLYYETIEGGHGAASTNDQQAEKWALIYSYLNMKLSENESDEI